MYVNSAQFTCCMCLHVQAYMERLGLWGEGLPHRRFESFMNSIMQRGLGAAEMIAMEMKAAGTYVCRGLSYQDTEVIHAGVCGEFSLIFCNPN